MIQPDSSIEPSKRFPSRRRGAYLVLVALVVAAGLASRKFTGILPTAIDQYPGDALWALMVMLMIGLLLPRLSSYSAAIAALTIAFAVEFSQRIQWQWLVAIRDTTLGHLVLGTTFHAPDLIAYSFGVVVGWLLERWLVSRPFTFPIFFHADV